MAPSTTFFSGSLQHSLLLVLTLLLSQHQLSPAAAYSIISNEGSGKVAVVTGASRGIGRGVALELGRAGYKVYVLGRSTRKNRSLLTGQRPLAPGLERTVESVAEELSSYNNDGIGFPVAVDLGSNDFAIADVLRRVCEYEGRLDLIVCSAYSVPPGNALRDDFWNQGMEMWDYVNGLGLRQVYNTCCNAAPYMISTATATAERDGGGRSGTAPLICLVSSFGGQAYTFNVAYGVGKAAVDRLASDMALQLRPYNVATVSLYPGLVRTEGNLQMEADGTWAEASGDLDLSYGETPELSGKAVVALAGLGREALMKRSGKVEVVAELARELDFSEDDGSRPSSIRSLKYILPNFTFKGAPGWVRKVVPDILLPWSVFSSPPPEK